MFLLLLFYALWFDSTVARGENSRGGLHWWGYHIKSPTVFHAPHHSPYRCLDVHKLPRSLISAPPISFQHLSNWLSCVILPFPNFPGSIFSVFPGSSVYLENENKKSPNFSSCFSIWGCFRTVSAQCVLERGSHPCGHSGQRDLWSGSTWPHKALPHHAGPLWGRAVGPGRPSHQTPSHDWQWWSICPVLSWQW